MSTKEMQKSKHFSETSLENWLHSMEYKRIEVTTKLIGVTDYKAIENTLKPNFKLK